MIHNNKGDDGHQIVLAPSRNMRPKDVEELQKMFDELLVIVREDRYETESFVRDRAEHKKLLIRREREEREEEKRAQKRRRLLQ